RSSTALSHQLFRFDHRGGKDLIETADGRAGTEASGEEIDFIFNGGGGKAMPRGRHRGRPGPAVDLRIINLMIGGGPLRRFSAEEMNPSPKHRRGHSASRDTQRGR